jgi:hypothetical protein
LEEILKDINTQVLETKYVINLGQLLKIVLDIKQYIFKPVKTIQLVQLVQLEPTYVAVVINHQMDVIQVQIGKNFIDDVLIHGGSRINILTMNLRV